MCRDPQRFLPGQPDPQPDPRRDGQGAGDQRRRAVATLAIGPAHAGLAELALPTHRAYADRVGAQHVVIGEARIGGPHLHYEKLQLGGLLGAWDRIVYLDIDALVRPDCPDLFAIVPPDRLGAFVESRAESRGDEIGRACRALGAISWRRDYFNAGVLVLGSGHRGLFAPVGGADLGEFVMFEQTLLNHRVAASGAALFDIGLAFNAIPPFLDRSVGETPEGAFIAHFAGLSPEDKLVGARRLVRAWEAGRPGLPVPAGRCGRVFDALVPARAGDWRGTAVDDGRVLLHPGGVVTVRLNETAALIVDRCDGCRTVAQIADALAEAYGLTGEEILRAAEPVFETLLRAGALTARNQHS